MFEVNKVSSYSVTISGRSLNRRRSDGTPLMGASAHSMMAKWREIEREREGEREREREDERKWRII